LFAQTDLQQKDFLLPRQSRSLQGIKPALADSKLAREVGDDELFHRPPRVKAPSVATIDDGQNVLFYRDMMGMEINISHGTGSYPLPPQGWQRSSRRTASHKPFTGPYFRSASTAYWLHVGVNRHEGGVSGEINL